MTSEYSFLVNSTFITDSCLPLCPLECNSTIYATSVTSVEIIGNLYADFIRSHSNISADFNNATKITPDEAKKNFVYLYLFYDSLSFTLTTEKPSMDVVSLLANIGGTMGLFLGLSMLHVYEIVDVLIEYLLFTRFEKRN